MRKRVRNRSAISGRAKHRKSHKNAYFQAFFALIIGFDSVGSMLVDSLKRENAPERCVSF